MKDFLLTIAPVPLSILITLLLLMPFVTRFSLLGQVWCYSHGERRWARQRTGRHYDRWTLLRPTFIPGVYLVTDNVMLLDDEGFVRC